MAHVPRFRSRPRRPTPSALSSDPPSTELKRLLRENERLRGIADNLPALIACIDAEHRITFANREFRRWHGASGEPVGRHLAEAMGDRDYLRRRDLLSRALAGEPVTFEDEAAAGDSTRILRTQLLPEVSSVGRVVGLYSLATDVTSLREAERRMAVLALTDTLTGLPNRRWLDAHLPEALARAKRQSTGLAVALLDVDHFKRINDNHGHAAGDAVLAAFADCLRGCLRATDFVARVAGDEFLFVLEGLHGAEECDEVACKVVAAVRQLRVDVAGVVLRCATSVGVAFLTAGRTIEPQRLIAQADEALYATKSRGRDGFTCQTVEGASPVNRFVQAP